MNNYSSINEMIKDINIISLENIIKEIYNINCKFQLENISDNGFEIYSSDLSDQTGAVGMNMFYKIYLRISCNSDRYNDILHDFENNKNNITNYFSIKFKYEHLHGGSNGYQLGRGWIGYNFESRNWEIVKDTLNDK